MQPKVADIDPLVPARAGVYNYRQAGFASLNGVRMRVPDLGTMVVEEATCDGRQVWRRYIDPGGPPSDVVQRWTPEGVYLESGVQRQKVLGRVIEIAARFDPPMLVVPWPMESGWSTSGRCHCGLFTPRVDLEVGEDRICEFEGRPYDVHVVRSTMESGGLVRVRGSQVDWVSWELASIYIRQTVRFEIRIGLLKLVDELSSELVSFEPRGR